MYCCAHKTATLTPIQHTVPPLLTKYPLDTIFTNQTKGVLFFGKIKNRKFTIAYSNNIIN